MGVVGGVKGRGGRVKGTTDTGHEFGSAISENRLKTEVN